MKWRDKAWFCFIGFCAIIILGPLLFGAVNLSARICYEIWIRIWR